MTPKQQEQKDRAIRITLKKMEKLSKQILSKSSFKHSSHVPSHNFKTLENKSVSSERSHEV